MSSTDRARCAAGAAGAALVVAAALLGVTTLASPAPEPRVTASAAPVRAGAAPPPAGPEASAVEQVSVELDEPGLSGSLSGLAALALTARPEEEPLAEVARRAAREDGLVGLGLALRARVRRPEEGAALLELMREERDPRALFQQARALGQVLDDAALRAAALTLLRELDGERRAAALVALLGRVEPEVVRAELELLRADPSPVVRGRSAALLAYAWPALAPADRDLAARLARAALAEPQAPACLVVGAADLLGQPDADPEDARLLRAHLARSGSPEALGALAQASALTGADPRELEARLRAVADDPAARPDVREAARRAVATLRDAPGGH